jgi:hypothetical protein
LTSTLFLGATGIALAALVWRASKHDPVHAAVAAVALVAALTVATQHPLFAAVTLVIGGLYWGSSRFRENVRVALEWLIFLSWMVLSLRDELSWPRPTDLQRLQLRAIRRIESNYRLGVRGERQPPTTARVLFNPIDYERYSNLIGEVESDIEQQVALRARGHRLLAPPAVHIVSDPRARRGWPRVEISFAGGTEDEVDTEAATRERTKVLAQPVLRRIGTAEEWLVTGATAIIGRVSLADVVVNDEHVSRRHCRIDFDGSTYFVTDMRSTNGTYLNGTRINGRARLDLGDTLGLGKHVTLVFAIAKTEAA